MTNKKLRTLAIALGLVFCSCTSASAQELNGGWISLSPIQPRDFGEAIAFVIEKLEKYYDRRRADSIGTLVGDLISLSAMENELANSIEKIAHTNSPLDGDGTVRHLNARLNVIRQQFALIRSDIEAIDRQWLANNAMVMLDVGNFASDGAIYYCFTSCAGQGPSGAVGGPTVIISHPGRADELVRDLRSDVAQISDFAKRLQAISAPH